MGGRTEDDPVTLLPHLRDQGFAGKHDPYESILGNDE